MELTWSEAQMNMAQKIVMERFALDSVAGHLVPHSTIAADARMVARNRFDFTASIVIDREVFGLFEPFSFCRVSKAQVGEFVAAQGDEAAAHTRAVTTLTRAGSALARAHDVLSFVGFTEGQSRRLIPPSVQVPPVQDNTPQSLRDAAIDAETEGDSFVVVNAPFNEGLVSAVYEAVLRLETRGYFTAYNLVLGQDLWQALHTPTSGSMILPLDRIKDTLQGGGFYRTTTLPPNEALLASLDGLPFDCVIAGDPAHYPLFEFLRVERNETSHEEFHVFRAVEAFAPRVRENRAIVRLKEQAQSAKSK